MNIFINYALNPYFSKIKIYEKLVPKNALVLFSGQGRQYPWFEFARVFKKYKEHQQEAVEKKD